MRISVLPGHMCQVTRWDGIVKQFAYMSIERRVHDVPLHFFPQFQVVDFDHALPCTIDIIRHV